MATKIVTRVCSRCRKLFEVKPRSYQQYCDECLDWIFADAGKRGGRPKKKE